jgi:hypothetical protein
VELFLAVSQILHLAVLVFLNQVFFACCGHIQQHHTAFHALARLMYSSKSFVGQKFTNGSRRWSSRFGRSARTAG